jgi:glycosyltransferase involved in cell wall biosynthesis
MLSPRLIDNGRKLSLQKLRVVHVVPALFGEGGVYGGAERYAWELARHMAEHVPTTLVSFGSEPRAFTAEALRVRVLGRPWHMRGQRTNPLHAGLLPELLRADVIHCHQQHLLTSSLSAILARLTGRRVFVTDLGGGGWDISAYVSTDRWYHGHLHISEYSRFILGQKDMAHSHVILGGVDVERFRPDPAAPRDGVVRFVGRLLAHKGVNDLIDAMPPDLPLEVIGRPYDPRFLADLQARAASKRVAFRHNCEDAELVAAYQRALCVVLPSVYRDLYGNESTVPELLGQTLLEGMACGIPAICTDVASMPEVVVEGVTGFVVPPNNPAALCEKLCWLRDHPAEAAQMGAAARRHVVENFTWPVVVRRCLAVYRG